MRGGGVAKATLGLTVGLLLGFGILAIKTYIAEQIAALLADEIAQSTSCKFETDSISISLLPIKAEARGVRMICQHSVALEFKKIIARVGLGELSKNTIQLTEVLLEDGLANGIGPDSPTFKFIDHLTEPISPEKDYPGRWKAKLLNLKLTKSKIIEPFSNTSLLAEGAEMDVVRDINDNFRLTPNIQLLSVIRNATSTAPSKTIVKLGHLRSLVYIEDGVISYKSLRLAVNNSIINADATSISDQADKLNGLFRFNSDAKSYDFPEWVRFALEGEGVFAGSLGSPTLTGHLSNMLGNPLSFGLNPSIPIIEFPLSQSRFEAELKRKYYKILLPDFSASGPNATLKTLNQISITNDDLLGKIQLHADAITFEDGTFYNVDGLISLTSKIYEPKVNFSGTAKLINAHDFIFNNFKIDFTHESNKIYLKATHKSEELGELIAEGNIILEKDIASFNEFTYKLNKFAVFQNKDLTNNQNFIEQLRISGQGNLTGPVSLSKAAADAKIQVYLSSAEAAQAVPTNVTLSNSALKLEINDPTSDLSGNLSFNLLGNEKSKINLISRDLRLQKYFPNLNCLRVAGEVNYTYDLANPWNGYGKSTISAFELGCAPYTINIDRPVVAHLSQGLLALPPTSLNGPLSAVLLQGEISALKGFNLNAQGHFELNSLITLIPNLDDLSGTLSSSIDIKGPLNAPLVSGYSKIQNGEFHSEALNLSATKINGEVTLESSNIKIQNLQGILNGGTAEIKGEIYPLDLAKSKLFLNAKGVSLEPAPNTEVQLAADLKLARLESGKAGIEGAVLIEGGEFAKIIDLSSAISSIANSIVTSSSKLPSLSKFPDLDLNIKVQAPRNLFIYTNWAGAELRGNLLVTGSINNPSIDGLVESITGWFGVKDRRFEITSGTLTFKSGSTSPLLEIVGESYVPSPAGETILVIAEARGSLSAPNLTLASDGGLSQREILMLLAAGGSSYGQTKVNTFSSNIDINSSSLLEDATIFDLPRLFSTLTRIDSLSFQPAYNLQTGLIEPYIIAEKQLATDFALIGQSSLGGSVTESRLKLLYDLSPVLKASVFTESVSTHQNAAFGGDLTYTILAKQRRSLDIEITGNQQVGSFSILRKIRLNENSKISVSDLSSIKSELLNYYSALGYLEAKADLACEVEIGSCSNLKITIDEGPLSLIADYIYDGDNLEIVSITKPKFSTSSYQAATNAFLEDQRQNLVRRLRAEGYIAARVDASYRPQTDHKLALVFDIRLGQPVSFIFKGNSQFSAREFLNTINLFDRKLPFGSNTINILLQNIERLYRNAGYLYATISANKNSDLTNERITYTIEIEEGPVVEVAAVRFTGINQELLGQLKLSLVASDPLLSARIFNPRYAIAEELDANLDFIKQWLIELGYPDALASYELENISEQTIAVNYLLQHGTALSATNFVVQGFPTDIQAPQEPQPPYSIPKANRYIDSIISSLKDFGYLNSAIWTELDSTRQLIIIHVEAGQRTHVGEISLDGILNIDQTTVTQRLKFQAGQGWNQVDFNLTKRELLRLGLFSRIDILAKDGNLDSATEDVVIRLTEKPLRTLEVGSGLNTQYGLHLYGEGIDRKTFADGRLLSLRVDTYYDSANAAISQGIAGLRYTDPNFLESDFNLAEDLRFQKINLSTQEFDVERFSLSSYLYKNWEEGLSLSFGHTLSGEDLTDVTTDAILSPFDSGHTLLSFISANFNFDRRNNPLNPTAGFNFNFEANLATEILGSAANFADLGAKFAWITPLHAIDSRFSLAFSMRTASAWAFDNTTEVPIAHRFYLGGRNSVRGFRENSLGPSTENGTILGGDMLFATNTEFRYLVSQSMSTHLFFDSGSVFLRSLSPDMSDLRHSAGLGFRYLSPLGPIGFDLGHPLDQKSGESSVRIHFSIGSNF